MSGISFNPNISISVDTARTVYGVTAEDLKTLNSDGNDKITLKELQAYGLGKNRALTEYFNAKTSGTLLAHHQQNKNDGSVKSNFMTNFTGGLSPKVNSDIGPSPLGNVLPYLYA
ncbi:hypothetical protein J6A64_03695 [bacterium]|nr:hypothetical protein [bacterium]